MINWLKKKLTKVKYVYPDPLREGYPIESGSIFKIDNIAIQNLGDETLYFYGKTDKDFWLKR